ncbi:MAG: glycoside hydrolase family 15 protein [Ktedonobacteraceae bacterium]|nr:glycoside hydrolase family 15 protein [Ktedonobacteraceae bacterium]
MASTANYLPIEDYAIIGDLHTVALVGKNGSIDWCCIPRFDAPSVFGALLDANKGGSFRIAPAVLDGVNTKQMYFPDTNVLITRFLSVHGVGEVTDFMSIKEANSAEEEHYIVRSVKSVRGTLSFTMICKPAFNYARDSHEVRLSQDGAVFASENLCLGLCSSIPLSEDGAGGVQATFTLAEGQTVNFLLQSASHDDITPRRVTDEHFQEAFSATVRYWRTWLAQCTYRGRWREMVNRSALALKLLTYAPTGAIIAAATTSLPETLGGTRNWDYRFTWLRDSAFTLYSLLSLGFTTEARAFMDWLDERCHELGPDGTLQPMYSIDGNHELTELTLDHLEGYRGSAPVRIGNGAYKQLQLDIYGELLDAIYIYNRYESISYDLWQHIESLLGWLSKNWQLPDEGIWEVRGGQRQFLHSRLTSWIAFDRALRVARQRGLPAPIQEWTETSAQIYKQIMEKGWNEEKQSFVQYYGSDTVDASSLLMLINKFTSSTDPRMLATLESIKKELTRDSLVYRYNTQHAADDGLGGSEEGTFTACSFWLAESLARAGQLDEARLMLEKTLSYSNHVGLFAEEIGSTGEALGNFPQAFTHLALITACYNVDEALNKAGHRDPGFM